MQSVIQRSLEIGPVVEISEETLRRYLSREISKDMLVTMTKLAQLDFPNHVYIMLILVQVFTRDGLQMSKQASGPPLCEMMQNPSISGEDRPSPCFLSAAALPAPADLLLQVHGASYHYMYLLDLSQTKCIVP